MKVTDGIGLDAVKETAVRVQRQGRELKSSSP